LNLDSHYACVGPVGVSLRRDVRGRFRPIPVPAAAAATSPRRQLGGDGGPLGLRGVELRAHRGLVRPLVRIETLHPFGQPVPLFRRSAAPGDALEQIQIRGAELGRALGAGDAAQQRVVLGDGRLDLGRRGRTRRARGARAALPRLFAADDRGLTTERGPVEADVGMGML
jgi:hypothetical protein